MSSIVLGKLNMRSHFNEGGQIGQEVPTYHLAWSVRSGKGADSNSHSSVLKGGES
jgi:hypothetical protein